MVTTLYFPFDSDTGANQFKNFSIMKTTIDTKTAGIITINSNYIGNKLWSCDVRMINYNNHIVKVTCK